MEGKLKVKPSVALKARPFSLDRVRLLDGPFKKAQDADHTYLLTLDVHRLLNGFYKNAGLEARGEAYGGWERMDIAGHSLGHFLTAASQMYAATGDAKLRAMVDEAVAGLKRCQKADGMLAGFPEAQRVWDELSRGDVRSQPFNLNGIWVPWYNQHKLLDGLIAAYLYCDSADALAIARGVADHAELVTRGLTPELWQRMLSTEHGGMNEVLANLYAITGARSYIELAKKFHHDRVLGPLEKGERRLAGLHGNTQVPKLIGAARIFELIGEKRFADASSNFWNEVIEDHTYVNGGNTMGEYFGPARQLSARIGSNTTETCNTHNMLKLTQHLYCWEPSVKLGDYYERALWNHILASVNPDQYGVTYFLPLGMGVRKQFSGATDDFTCCHGSGMENHAKYGGAVFYEGGDTLYIDQFVSSELDWKEKGVRVELEAQTSGTVHMKFRVSRPVELEIKVRCPSWVIGRSWIDPNKALGITEMITARPGEYLSVKRVFRDGDLLMVQCNGGMRVERMPDDPQRVAVMSGPVLMVGIWPIDAQNGLAPVLVPGDLNPLEFFSRISWEDDDRLAARGLTRPYELEFVPFYMVKGEKYSVFFDLMTEPEWSAKLVAHEAEQERVRELESRTIEFVDVGSQRTVRSNNLKGENSFTGTLNERRWRDARDGGFFEFEIKSDPIGPNQLMLTYWGSDGGNRTFDVIVDGAVIASQRLTADRQGEFFDVVHDLPLELTKGKERLTVRIQAKPGSTAGGVFGVRTVRPKP